MNTPTTSNVPAKPAGIQLRSVLFLLLFISVLVSAMALTIAGQVSSRYEGMIDAMNSLNTARDAIDTLGNTSDYLTEQVRQYVVTEDASYLQAYFTELNDTKRREEAVDTLLKQFSQTQAYDALSRALDDSNTLASQECYAMALLLEHNGQDVSGIPQLKETVLTAQDLRLDKSEAAKKAYDLVFGETYTNFKSKIQDEVLEATSCVKEIVNAREESSMDLLSQALFLQRIITFLMLFLILFLCIFIYLSVVRRLSSYVACLQSGSKLPLKGMVEFRYLAATYNDLYERNLHNRDKLIYTAEHDALTDVLNRTVLASLKTDLSRYGGSVTLIVLDIDLFKQINDSRGHETGDQVLITVARVLKRSFRDKDFILRYGGDEFLIFLLDLDSGLDATLKSKYDLIMKQIAREQELNPALSDLTISLSAGYSYSLSGYAERLFGEADAALYEVKRGGRGRIAGYSPDLNITKNEPQNP